MRCGSGNSMMQIPALLWGVYAGRLVVLTVWDLWGRAPFLKVPVLAHDSRTNLTPLCIEICSNDASFPCRTCMSSCMVPRIHFTGGSG